MSIADTVNGAGRLAREIMRVAILLQICRGMQSMPGVCVGPIIAMMERALEKACVAAGTDDALVVIESIKELEGFKD